MAKYRLVFAGELLHGTDRTKCVQMLSKLVHETPERLAVKLFGGRHVVVKQTDDEKVVRTFVKAFKKAGAVLLIDVNKGAPEEKRMLATDVSVTRVRKPFSAEDVREDSPLADQDEAEDRLDDDDPTLERSPEEALRGGRRRRRRRR